MLRKLMKYEFKALLPPLGLVYAVVGILAIMLYVTMSGYNGSNPGFFPVIIALIFAVAQPAMFVVLLVLLVGRLSNNLLGDEGYIMMTLPVSIHKLLWSKLLVAMVCFILTALVAILSSSIYIIGGNLAQNISLAFSADFLYAVGSYTPYIIEFIFLFFAAFFAFGIGIYAAVSLGYTFQRKQLMSVVFCFLLYILGQTFWTFLYTQGFMLAEPFLGDISSDIASHLALLIPAVINALCAVVFYFFTVHNLSKKLNLP